MSRPLNRLSVCLLVLGAIVLFMAGCTESRITLGEAYVAPMVLRVRGELSSKSNTVAELKHGEHVEIVDVQRRMVKIHTDKGAEGWVDSLQLLSQEQMDQLKAQRKQQAALPTEGTATAYELLNIHIEPDRQSPAFAQIPEGGPVFLLGHKVTPKNTSVPKAQGLIIAKPQAATRKQRREQQSRALSFKLPPKPPAPKAPENWEELGTERIDGEPDPLPAQKAPQPVLAKPQPAKPVVLEDWTLIKTKKGETGWVLTRNLMIAIPDEVAQYAEGKRITAFFDLGVVNDEEKGPKHNWLWTTTSRATDYDFDSWRVFLWNSRRHRYETSYRQRDVEGYFPVHVDPADAGSPLRTFQLIMKDDDGKMRRRSYTFDGHLVHLSNTEDYNPSMASTGPNASGLNPGEMASKAPKASWFKRQWNNLKHRFSK